MKNFSTNFLFIRDKKVVYFCKVQTLKTSKAKENILSKIRKSLSEASLPIPFPELEKDDSPLYKNSSHLVDEIFAENFIGLGGKFVFCDNDIELLQNLVILHENMGWQHLMCSNKRIEQLFLQNDVPILSNASEHIEQADACITDCELLVARTGSILFSSSQHMGRTAPIFYPVHIVVAYTDQIVADLKDGLDLLKKKYGNDLPSMINLNTGPSRTADIEKTLVVGVHGPGEVFCFLVNR